MNTPSLIPRFLEVCPAFRRQWEEHLAYLGGEAAGEYNDMSELALFVVESYVRGDMSCLPPIFALIESILETGDAEQQQMVSVGLLESIQIRSTHEKFGPDAFLPYLGTHSHDAWAWISHAWEGKDTLADVVRAERQQLESPPEA